MRFMVTVQVWQKWQILKVPELDAAEAAAALECLK